MPPADLARGVKWSGIGARRAQPARPVPTPPSSYSTGLIRLPTNRTMM